MINELVKRPGSRQKSHFRPTTGKVSEENKKQSDQCFQVGKKHMIRKQYEQAIKHYSNAIIHDPHNFKALCNIGSIYKQHNQYTQAQNCYSKALFEHPNDLIALYNLGNLERILGCDEIAMNYYNRVRALKQNQNIQMGQIYYNTLINQGICYKNLRLYDQAILCNDQAIKINSDDVTGYFNKSMCLFKKIYAIFNKDNLSFVRKKLCQDAKKCFQKVIGFNCNNYVAKISLIQLNFLQNLNQENIKISIKQLEELKNNVPNQQVFKIDIKIKYCQNLLKTLQQQANSHLKKQKIQISSIKKQNNTDNKDSLNTKQQKQSTDNKIKNQQHPSEKQIHPTSNIALQQSQIQKNTKKDQPIKQSINTQRQHKKQDQESEIAQSVTQKYQQQIIQRFKKSQQTQNTQLLQSALDIYKQHIIMYNFSTPISKNTCSQKGHEVIANMLNITQNYSQASKHYQVLLQLIQENNDTLQENKMLKIQNIQAELGVCYERSGMHNQAIKQYKKCLQLQPDNYSVMSNLCSLLIESDQKQQAKKYYEEYIKKKEKESIPNKAEYVDCLLNNSICQRDTDKQVDAIEKTLKAIQQYFPTCQLIKQNLNEVAVVELYLRKADLLQDKYQHSQVSPSQKKQNNEELLDLYLTCLQFDSCPDREAISANAGILFYMSGCYANALSFFKTMVVKRNQVANSMGLALIRLQQYQKALYCFQDAIQEYPQNIIYAANYQILKWICGIKNTHLSQKYNCGCQAIFVSRLALGLWMLDQLTLMIQKNQIKSDNDKDSLNTVRGSSKMLIDKLFSKLEIKPKENQQKSNKIAFLKNLLDNHMLNCLTKEANSKKKIPSSLLDICMKRCKDVTQLTQNTNSLIQILKKINNEYEQQYLIIQSIICLTILSNVHLKDSIQTIKKLLINSQINYLKQYEVIFENRQHKQNKDNQILQKQIQLNNLNIAVNIKILQSKLSDIECLLQNQIHQIIQYIQKIYYQNSISIISPIQIQYCHPHCQNIQNCKQCLIKSCNIFCGLFNKIMEIELIENQQINIQISILNQKFNNFINNCLENQQNNIYSKQNKKIKIKLSSKLIPFRLVTHHKSFNQVQKFVKNIDNSFDINTIQNSQKGVIVGILNKSMMLEMWWGESVTTYDKFYRWLIVRQSNMIQDSLYVLGVNINKLVDNLQQGEQLQTKITQLFKMH